MGNGVEWAYMLPIEAVFQSISKTLASIHPDLPSPEVQIAREEVVNVANENDKILSRPEDRLKLSISESPKLELSESRSDRQNHENMPAASTLPGKQHSTKRRSSDLTDGLFPSDIVDESLAWTRKAVLSLGKNLTESALLTLIWKLQTTVGYVCILVF